MSKPCDLRVRISRRQPSTPHRRLDGHTEKVTDLTVVALPDGGELLVSAGVDRVAVVWDPLTGEQIARLIGHQGAIRAVCSFTEPDGTPCVVTGGDDGSLRFWEPSSGEPVGEQIRGDFDAVKELVAWRDGDRRWLAAVASTGKDHDVILAFDPATREPIGPPIHSTAELSHLGVCELNGQPVLVALEGEQDSVSIRLWEATTGNPVSAPIELPDDGAEAMVVLPVAPERSLLAVILDEHVVLVDPATGKFVGDALVHAENQTSALTWFQNPDGEIRLVSVISTLSELWVAKFPSVTIWDPVTGEELGQFPTGYLGLIDRIVSLEGGRTVAVAGADGSLRLWNLEKALSHRLRGVSGREGSGAPLHHVPEDDGPGLLLTTRDRLGLAGENLLSDEQEYDLWDAASGELVGTLPDLLIEAGVHIGADGRAMVITLGGAGEVTCWDPRTLTVERMMPTVPGQYWLLHPEPGGTRVACAGHGAGTDVWDLATGELVTTVGEVEPDAVAWVPTEQGPRLVVCDMTGLTSWQPGSGELSVHRTTDGAAPTWPLRPGPGWLAVGDHEGRIRVWDADSLEVISTLATSEGIVDAAPLPDDRIVTCSGDGGIDLWHPRTGTHLAHHDLGMVVRGLAALPDGALALGVPDGWLVVEPPWV